MEEIDFVISEEDRLVLVECVTLLREAGLDEIVEKIESVLNNLVEL